MNTYLKPAVSLVVLFLLMLFVGPTVEAQTLYSRKTPGNWNDNNATTGTWSTSPGGASCGCYPGDATHTLGWSAVVSTGHTITLTSTAYTLNSIVALTINGTLIFGTNGGTARTLAITGDVTVSSGGIFRSGTTGATSHILQVGGDLINNGSYSQTINTPTNQSIVFASTLGARTIRGSSATTTFYNMFVSSTAGSLSFGDNTGTSRTLTIANDLTVATLATLQSGNTGSVDHTIQLGGTLTNNGTINFTANSVTNHTFNFNGTAAESILGSATTAYTFYNIAVTGAGAVSFGNNANARTITIENDLTIDAGSTLQSGASGAIAQTINVGANVTNNGVLNFRANSATAHTLAFNGSVAQDLAGSGTYTFNNLTVAGSSGNININTSIAINGAASALTFSSNRLLVVNSTSNITLAATATISGANTNRYIQLDGSSGSGSQLIKTTTTTASTWQTLFPIGTNNGGYTPLDLSAATLNNAGNGSLSVKAIYNNSIQGQLRRTFRLTTVSSAATTFSNGRFYINSTSDVSGGDALANYTQYWYLNNTGGSWGTLAGTINNSPGGNFPTNPPGYYFSTTTANQALSTGTYYYTMGAAAAYPNTWYTYQSGVWSNWENWTLDPSGLTVANGLQLPPQPGDAIVILNGITITNDANDRSTTTTTINSGGTLDMATTTGNTLGTVSGSGLLRVAGVTGGAMALPTGIYNSFVAAGTGGTIEYYDNTGNLPVPAQSPAVTTASYNNLIISNSTGAGVTVTSINNLTVSGNFTITATGAGTAGWQINDLSDVQRTIILNGDLTVGAGGRISVGGTNANNTDGNENSTTPHSLTIYGNFTNNGIVKFFFDDTELLEADYGKTSGAVGVDLHRNELQGNAVTVTFSGTTSKTVTCNNKTDFYRLILNKGTGQQAVLTINSSNTANFRLFGPANIATVESGGTANYVSANALSIVNGTLELTGSINIPVLQINTSGTGYFPIPLNGALWLNGPNVTVQITDMNTATFGSDKDGRILISGLLRITDGTLFDGFSKGLGSQDGGSYLQEGGTVTCWQFRPRSVAGNPPFSFTQTGGVLNVGYGYGLSGGKIDIYEEDYARFDLRSSNSTFQMSGNAVLNVAKPTSNADAGVDGGLFVVASTPNNVSVTGGTVNLYTGVERSTGESYPGYVNTTAPFYNLNIYEESATTQNTELQTNSIVVLNDLTIHTGNTPSFITNNLNVTVGGNFIIESGTTYNGGTGVTTFNGSGAQSWTNDGTITSPLANVVVNKSAGTLTLGGSTHATFLNAAGTGTITNLTLTSGTMADNGKILTVTGALSNSATHSGSGQIIYSNGAASNIGGNNGTFGNLTITTSFTHTLLGAQTVTGNLRLTNTNTTLDVGLNALRVLGGIYSDASPGTAEAFGNTKRIVTNGMVNAGGLTRQAADATDLLFPIGSSGVAYTPITINVDVNNSGGTVGTITVRPVNAVHPNVTTASQSVRYYWRVTSSGFNLISAVNHKSYIYSTAVRDAAGVNYRAARFDPDAFTWATSNTLYNSNAAPGTTTIALGSSPYTFNTATAWTGVTGTKLDGEYTAGNLAAFGAVKVFYSRQSGPWIESTTWSNTAVGGVADVPVGNTTAGTHYPAANSPVVIGDGTVGNGHTITTGAAARFCGRLTLDTLATLDCGTVTGHNFGTNSSGVIGGRGRLRIGATGVAVAAMFPGGDFTDFVGPNGGTVEWYGNSKTLPTAGPNTALTTYYNLVLNPSAGNTITLPGSNLTVYNDLTQGDQAAYTGVVTTNGARTITVAEDLNITRGTFGFSNVAASATTMVVSRHTTIGTGASFGVVAGGTVNANTFTTTGNITNNGTIRFRDTGTVDITFTGSTSTTFGGTGSVAAAPNGTTLNLVTVNKGSSQAASVTFSVGGTVTAANTTVIGGWLRLVNGTFIFATTGTHSIITRNNGDANDTYTIPSTAKLQVNSGTVNVLSATNNFADLLLNGTLQVAGGTVNIAGGTSGNDIEYAAAGSPSIVVSAGTLNVNGSIRRSTSVLTGALTYNQTNGAVTVRGYAADDTRGVFEIDANGSSDFTLLNSSTLTVERQTNGTDYADVFINPVTSNVSATSTIAVGLTTATTQNNLRVNIAPTIGNFTVLGPGANANPQTVNLFSNPMVLGGNLTITTPSVLNTNSLDVSIARNLVISGSGTGANAGTYTGGTNTTTFNGTTTQSANLTAVSTFNNMTINNSAGATVALSGAAPTLNNLNILSGVLDVGSLGLNVNGNIVNNSSQISTPGTGSVILAGTATTHTITSSNGSFHNLTLGGSSTTKVVSVDGNMTINGQLNFTALGTSRYLSIGSNRLTFSQAATISNAGATRFIRTNGVASDLGVLKNWAAGAATFVYAVGTRTNYTPATMTLTVTSPGTFTVVPVDDQHPTANALGEQILNYYWIVTRGGGITYSNTGSHSYQFVNALLGGSGGTVVAAHLDALKLVGWTTTGHGGTVTPAGTPTLITFTNSLNTNLPGTGGANPEVEFHYTAGTNTAVTATLPNPITPVYSRLDLPATVGNASVGGSWNLATNWTTSSTGIGGTIQQVSPTGRPVVILNGARINMNIVGLRAFTTGIYGLLVMTNPTGHNLGTISGTGTLRATTSTLPLGNYTNFVSAAGGTIEYSPSADININVNRTVYNNLIISGANIVSIPNVTSLALNGNLSIGASATLNNTGFNKDISIAGNITNLGTFNVGTGAINFNGSSDQSISGNDAFFYNMGVSKSGGNVILNVPTTVTNALTLTDGSIVTTSANPLILTSAATSNVGDANSFVSGPMLKTFNGSFTFPVGSVTADRYRPAIVSATSASDTWTVEYVGNDPTAQGYNNRAFNQSAPASLGRVSQFEYWNVSRTGATTGALELTYNTGSYVPNPSNIGNVANLKVVRWDGAKWDLPPGGGTMSQTGSNVTGTVKVSVVSSFSPFTFGSTDFDSPLPINLLSFNAKLNNTQVDLTWKTAQEFSNDYFVVEKAKENDLENFAEVGTREGQGDSKEEHAYSLTDANPYFGKSYYRLKQVDFNGSFTYSEVKMIEYDGPAFATLRAYPNPYGVKKEELYIEILGLKDTKLVPVKMYNLQGQVILEKIFEVSQEGQLKETIKLANRPAPGVYILKAGMTLQLTQKIVIE